MMVDEMNRSVDTMRMGFSLENILCCHPMPLQIKGRTFPPTMEDNVKPMLLPTAEKDTKALPAPESPRMILKAVIQNILNEQAAPKQDTLVALLAQPVNRRRVRFLVGLPAAQPPAHLDSTRQTEEQHAERAASGTDDEAADRASSSELYWTKDENNFARKRAGSNGFLVRSKYPDQVQAMERLYASSARPSGDANPAASSDDGSDDDDDEVLLSKSDLQVIRMWSRSKARGLEECVLPQIRQNRRKAVDAVLEHQAQSRQSQHCAFRTSDHFALPPSKRQRIHEISSTQESLRRRSLAVSQRSREFAARMGLGDAMAAYDL